MSNPKEARGRFSCFLSLFLSSTFFIPTRTRRSHITEKIILFQQAQMPQVSGIKQMCLIFFFASYLCYNNPIITPR